MIEDGIEFERYEGVFYNPHMRLSRLISSAAVSAIGEKLNILDGFAATGIRGIRYFVENDNVDSVDFVDIDENAFNNIVENVKRYNVKGEVYRDEINNFLFNSTGRYNFIELDPFGTPSPFMYMAVRALRASKVAYLSFTATDTAVLCGVHKKACLKNYQSIPLHNSFCHETGIRILISFASRIAASFNFFAKPLISFYYRHQMKVIMRLERGKDRAHRVYDNIANIHFCRHCLYTSIGWEGDVCPNCGHRLSHGGPIWVSQFSDSSFVSSIIDVINRRENIDDKFKLKAIKFLEIIRDEQDFPPWHVDTHEIAEIYNIEPPRIKSILGRDVVRTHFNPHSVKTRMSIKSLVDYIRKR